MVEAVSVSSCPPSQLPTDRTPSAAVGQSAIRLAALAGYKVVTTASPRNFDLVKSLGASAAFDYRATDVVSQIKAATGDSLKKALDAAGSGKDSQGNTAEALGPSGGKVVLVSPPIPGATSRTDVELQCESGPFYSPSDLSRWLMATGCRDDRLHLARPSVQFGRKVYPRH